VIKTAGARPGRGRHHFNVRRGAVLLACRVDARGVPRARDFHCEARREESRSFQVAVRTDAGRPALQIVGERAGDRRRGRLASSPLRASASGWCAWLSGRGRSSLAWRGRTRIRDSARLGNSGHRRRAGRDGARQRMRSAVSGVARRGHSRGRRLYGRAAICAAAPAVGDVKGERAFL